MKSSNSKLRSFLLLCLFSLLVSCVGDEEKPNFILIQMDDLGWDDLGIHGNHLLETPNLDRLAQRSVQFSNYYVNPVCAPSRASLLTGRDFLRTGVSHVHGGKDFLHLNEATIADILQKHGYATGMWGKWHSGSTKGYFPWERGFDEAFMARLYKHEHCQGMMNGVSVQHTQWADEVIIDYAIEFIERNKSRPFFAYLPSMTCHEPLAAPEEIISKYRAKGLSENLSTLYAMVDYFDSQVQRLLDLVKEAGLSDNTVILFMSDNGPAINNGLFTDEDREIRYINKLKGHKGNIWENGVKSPLFVKWEKRFKPGEVKALADGTDIFPSILEMAGIKPGQSNTHLDGSSFLSLLEGRPNKRRNAKMVFNYANQGWPPTDLPWTPEGVKEEYRPVTPQEKQNLSIANQIISVRQGSFKLLLNPDVENNGGELSDGYALYNINEDPGEQHNLISEEPELGSELKTILSAWFTGIKESPHAFNSPVFRIGDLQQESSTIMGKGPMKNSQSLSNTFNSLDGWSREGEFAEYRVEIAAPGKYLVNLKHAPVEAEGVIMKLIAGDRSTSGMLQGDHSTLGEISLEAEDKILRLEIAHIPESGNCFLLKSLQSIELQRL